GDAAVVERRAGMKDSRDAERLGDERAVLGLDQQRDLAAQRHAEPAREVAPDDDRVRLHDILVVPEFSLDERARDPYDARLGGGTAAGGEAARRGVGALREGLEADARRGGGDGAVR